MCERAAVEENKQRYTMAFAPAASSQYAGQPRMWRPLVERVVGGLRVRRPGNRRRVPEVGRPGPQCKEAWKCLAQLEVLDPDSVSSPEEHPRNLRASEFVKRAIAEADEATASAPPQAVSHR